MDKVNEHFLYHGLNASFIPGITKFGFDPRYCSLEGMFGAGLYFAEHSSKSNQYVHSGNCTISGPGTAVVLFVCLASEHFRSQGIREMPVSAKNQTKIVC